MMEVPSADEIAGRNYCKWHNSWTHSTKNCLDFLLFFSRNSGSGNRSDSCTSDLECPSWELRSTIPSSRNAAAIGFSPTSRIPMPLLSPPKIDSEIAVPPSGVVEFQQIFLITVSLQIRSIRLSQVGSFPAYLYMFILIQLMLISNIGRFSTG